MRAALLLAVLVVAFYWKLTLSREFTFLASPDLAYQVLPWYEFQARAWHSGTFPLWDPYQWCGQPLLGQLQPGATFPLNWPLFWAPLHNGRLNINFVHWHFVLMHVLAALFLYAYCRELGRSRFASLLAGAGFSLVGYLGTTTWPQMMNGALWTPLMFLFYYRASRAATPLAAVANAAGGGVALGCALLAGHHQIPLFLALAVGGLALYHVITRRQTQRALLVCAGIALFAALTGGFALIPAWEYGAHSYRWLNLPSPLRMNQTVPYLAQQGLGVIPLSLLGLVAPVNGASSSPFVGIVVASLALLGIAAAWKERAVRLHSCLALGGLAYALGSYSIFQGVLYATLPFLDKARSPGHALLLFDFGALVIAAYGVDSLDVATVWRPRLQQALLAGAASLWGALLLLAARGTAFTGRAENLMLVSVIAVLLAAVWRASLPLRFRQAGILLLLLIETSAATSYLMQPRTRAGDPTFLDRLSQHRGVVAFLKAQPRPFRFHADDNEIPNNLGDSEALEATAGYLASVSADLYDFVGLDWTHSALYLNQVFVVARQKSRPEQIEVYSEPDGLKVFRNPDALPRAWLVHEAPSVPDRPAAAALMRTPGFDAAHSAFLIGPAPALEACEGGSVEITSTELQRVSARASAPCRTMVVFSDPWFPGWQARVDERPVQLYAAYGALRGIVVPAGQHTIELTYRPRSAYAGAAFSVSGLAGWLCLALAARRESRRSAVPAGP